MNHAPGTSGQRRRRARRRATAAAATCRRCRCSWRPYCPRPRRFQPPSAWMDAAIVAASLLLLMTNTTAKAAWLAGWLAGWVKGVGVWCVSGGARDHAALLALQSHTRFEASIYYLRRRTSRPKGEATLASLLAVPSVSVCVLRTGESKKLVKHGGVGCLDVVWV